MGERGPKPNIVLQLAPSQRVELDEAIIDGRQTKVELFDRYGKPLGISYSAFCNYAAQFEARAKHRYVNVRATLGVFHYPHELQLGNIAQVFASTT